MSRWTARAPGRLDVMGGIADYSGSLVLQWPIRESTTATMQFVQSQVLHIVSQNSQRVTRTADIPLALINAARPPYVEIHAWCTGNASRQWAAYIAGVFAVLAGDRGLHFDQGAIVEIRSDIPEGKGVSSSAALEAATMTALLAALESRAPTIAPREAALLCQRAENLVVGAPCGVMDQMTVIAGRAGHLLNLLCQPAELRDPLRLPPELAVFGIDSGIRHAVSGSDYTGVRVGAFMGYRILADLAGLTATEGQRDGHVHVDDPRWGGYLANVGTSGFHEFEVHVPNTLSGAAFLKRYGGTTDLVTTVDPDRCYPVWTPTAHPIYEHERVTEWAGLLQQGDDRARAERMGELMYQSHASYSACGLGSDGTDLLVDLARAHGVASGIYGAKITGGGSGGTVAVLAGADRRDIIDHIARTYAERTGREPYVFEGTSDGASITGAQRT